MYSNYCYHIVCEAGSEENMSAATVKIKISPENNSVMIGFPESVLANGEMCMSKKQLLKLVRVLGSVHQRLEGEGEPMPSCNFELNSAVEAPWFIEFEQLTNSAAISFCHPGFGPVTFLVPTHKIRDLMRGLALVLAAPSKRPVILN